MQCINFRQQTLEERILLVNTAIIETPHVEKFMLIYYTTLENQKQKNIKEEGTNDDNNNNDNTSNDNDDEYLIRL